ncbi:MAG TPA: thioredoxin domain-containing protein [Bryobacteraceae bacterium]|nr:thioredoxin domain-containing protein [Bryobacteraceae bacterium]
MRFRSLALAALLPGLAVSADWDRAKIQGSTSAPVAIEVFGSFDCVHCKILHEGMLQQIVQDLVVTGKACVISREFPLAGPYHKYARDAANLATAAARIGKYQPVADALFKNQQEWETSGKVWETVAGVLAPAEQVKVKALASDPGVLAEVQKDYDQGAAMGINQTPTVMVIRQRDGKRYPFPGIQITYEMFRDFITKDLAK